MSGIDSSPFRIPDKPLWEMDDGELRDILLWAAKPEEVRYKMGVLQELIRREIGHERDAQTLIDMGR